MTRRASPPSPTQRQYRITRAVTRWYLERYFQTSSDVGVAAMFCDPARVGHFAVSASALADGDDGALFRLLVTMTMFQRRSDEQVMRVLRGISAADAAELTDASALLELADAGGCPHLESVDALRDRCDLAKDAETKEGVCRARPERACHLKRHTVLLKRYGHFGKVPTSAALMLREHGVTSLNALRRSVWEHTTSPTGRAAELQRRITRAWRISEKIAAMFLSSVTNSDLSGALAPWREGVDTAHFVVVDSNVDLFLSAIGYDGPGTYCARREFIQRLARRVALDDLRPGLTGYNPRIVQQAAYMFMSLSNRRSATSDCGHDGWTSCANCPADLFRICGRKTDVPRLAPSVGRTRSTDSAAMTPMGS